MGEAVIDIKGIMSRIPHRYPFLLVDKIVEITSDGVVGLKNVTANEPHFQGHWPDEPVMPGVLQREALAQTGAVLLFGKLAEENPDATLDVFFRRIDKAIFRKVVRPRDQLFLHVKVLKQRRELYVMSGQAIVDGQVASEAEMTAVVKPRGETDGTE